MPEGPELHVASRLINTLASSTKFSGNVAMSAAAVAKNWPNIDFGADIYAIKAETRGKELKMWLRDEKKAENKLCLRFRFGMSGSFVISRRSKDDQMVLPKHAHLTFTTCGGDFLSYVDVRRFGSYEISEDWGINRGPDPITEHKLFRDNLAEHMEEKVFDSPICELMLDQKYFNGIGNYLRAEILYRASVPPFAMAREVLQSCSFGPNETNEEGKKVKREPDLLDYCKIVPEEVLSLHDDYEEMYGEKHMAHFNSWLRCYSQSGMANLVDRNNRTIWFSGEPGKLVPKGAKARRQAGKAESNEHDYLKKSKSRKQKPKESEIKAKDVKSETIKSVKVEDEGLVKQEGKTVGRRQSERLRRRQKTADELFKKLRDCV